MADFLNKWMNDIGPENDVVLSSRIRLARNFENIPFSSYGSNDNSKEVIDRMKNLLDKNNKFNLKLLSLGNMTRLNKNMLVEQHLISPELAKGKEGKAVILSEDESISLMLNEEDHIRLQTIFSGLRLEEGWELANKIDDYIEKEINLAFDEKYGYLTSCPTNVGTGLRASIMVHLPALAMTKRVNKIVGVISQLDFTVRGLYGEGTDAIGNLYQISNQVTLGRSEEEIIENLLEVTYQIMGHEREAREILLREKEIFLKDRIFRSYGVLNHAYKISIEEAMKLISYVRLGVDLGIIGGISLATLNQLMLMIRPASLQILKDDTMVLEQIDIYRAKLIREIFSKEG